MTAIRDTDANTLPPGRLDVLFVMQHLQAGGAERVTVLLANELAARGIKVAIAIYVIRGEFVHALDSRVALVEIGGAGLLSAIPPLTRLVRRCRPTALIGVMVSANVAAVIAGKLAFCETRIFLTEHSQVDKSAAFYGKGSRAYKAIRWCYPLADAIVCVSDGVRDSLCRYSGMRPAKMHVIHNPIISPEIEHLSQEPCGHAWLGDEDVPLILAVGRLTKAKNYPMLLQAFALLRRQRRARLLILGQGEDRKTLTALVGELGLGDDVDMPGYEGNPYAVMSRADLFVLSSEWEGFPTVLVEALACGAAVVATDCPSGPREIMLDGALGPLVPVGDVQAFADAMVGVLDAPPPREAMIARGRSFSVERAADAYERLLFDTVH